MKKKAQYRFETVNESQFILTYEVRTGKLIERLAKHQLKRTAHKTGIDTSQVDSVLSEIQEAPVGKEVLPLLKKGTTKMIRHVNKDIEPDGYTIKDIDRIDAKYVRKDKGRWVLMMNCSGVYERC